MNGFSYTEIEWFMGKALDEAMEAYRKGEVPVGAVVVSEDKKIVSAASNLKELLHDPIAHAEILCIQQLAKKLKNWRLTGHSLFVTLEPCPMCLGALMNARLSHLFFGAYDYKGGAVSLGYDFYQDNRMNHEIKIVGGVKHFEMGKILSQFFKERRLKK